MDGCPRCRWPCSQSCCGREFLAVDVVSSKSHGGPETTKTQRYPKSQDDLDIFVIVHESSSILMEQIMMWYVFIAIFMGKLFMLYEFIWSYCNFHGKQTMTAQWIWGHHGVANFDSDMITLREQKEKLQHISKQNMWTMYNLCIGVGEVFILWFYIDTHYISIYIYGMYIYNIYIYMYNNIYIVYIWHVYIYIYCTYMYI